MNRKLFSAAILATAIVSATACKKDKSTPNYAKADDFMASHAIKEQSFTGNAGAGFTITG